MYQRILVPIDGSATSDLGLDEAVKLAALTGARLRLIHVVDELTLFSGFEPAAVLATDMIPLMKEAGEKILAAGKARVAAAGIVADTFLYQTYGAAVFDLVVEQAQAWKADLIVIGTHGRRGVDRLLMGSDAEQILRIAPVPVLLVRGKKDAAPPCAEEKTASAAVLT
jgi:nucleotide-binding universal stress UspA family protein